jgi:hypothetical protein
VVWTTLIVLSRAMTTGCSATEILRRALWPAAPLLFFACTSAEQPQAAATFSPAIACMAYIELHVEAVREVRETGNPQSLAVAYDIWRGQALAAAAPEQVERMKAEAKTALRSRSDRQVGDEAANCIARAPRHSALSSRPNSSR